MNNRVRHFFRVSLSILLVCAGGNKTPAQEKPAPPQFEAATVKPVDPNVPHMVGVKVQPGGTTVLSGMSLRALIATAFQLSYWQISGGESWTDKDAFTVEAKPPENLRSTIRDLRYSLFEIEDEQLRAMLQTLLIERFQLKFHRETKTHDIYLLQRSGKTLGLRTLPIPSQDEASAPDNRLRSEVSYVRGRWFILATSIPQLAKFASAYVVRAPVLDQTALPGTFEYKQDAPDPEPNYSDNSDSFLHMISDVGLKLVRTKGPAELFVIDSASKPLPN